MDNAELLSHFEDRVDEFDKIQGFIEKAESQASKFAAAVVEKVIKTNTEKGEAIVEELIPLMSDMDGVVEGLEGQKADVVAGQQQSKLDLEELELRLLIQELTDKDFDKKSSGLKKELEESNGKIDEFDAELAKFRDQLNRWQELGQRAGVLESGELDAADILEVSDEEELSVELESVDSPGGGLSAADESDEFEGVVFDDAADAEIDLGDLADEDVIIDDRDGIHSEKVSVTEDLSDVLDDESDESDESDEAEEDFELEVGDESDDEVELEMGEARQAVLIYSEGNDDEQVYPFVDDALRLGRGRDNDIQVKNDSKVSRYHCRVVYKEDKYVIEDNKSANGTLVDGAPITERQLIGGEELTIGETIFHFRLMA